VQRHMEIREYSAGVTTPKAGDMNTPCMLLALHHFCTKVLRLLLSQIAFSPGPWNGGRAGVAQDLARNMGLSNAGATRCDYSVVLAV